jgi:hypothetical protein
VCNLFKAAKISAKEVEDVYKREEEVRIEMVWNYTSRNSSIKRVLGRFVVFFRFLAAGY